jgi:uncharacterized membrane protein
MANEVRIKMTADDLASGKIKDVGNSAENTADKFRNMRGTFLAMGAAGAAITGVLALFTKSALEQQVGVNLLDNALQNVGHSYAAEKESIEAVIGALQDKTNIGDEDQRQSLATLIALTGDYEVSLQALEVIADMATAMQMDFSVDSILVAKALAGQTSSLSRYGITIDSSATKTEVLAALTEKFGGAAEAAANPMTQLGNRTGDFAQAIGDVLVPLVMKLLPTMERLTKSTVEFMENNEGLTTAVVILAGVLGALLIVGGAIGLLIPTMAFAYAGLASAVAVATGAKLLFTAALWGNVAAWIALHAATGGLLLVVAAVVAAVVVGLVLLVKNWDKVYNAIKTGINFLIDGLNKFLNAHIILVNKIIEGVNKLGEVFGKEIDTIATDVIPKLGFAIKHVDDNTQDYFKHTQTGWAKTTRVVRDESEEIAAIIKAQNEAAFEDAMTAAENIVSASNDRYARLKAARWKNVADEKEAAKVTAEEARQSFEDALKAKEDNLKKERALFRWQADFQRDLRRQQLNDALEEAAAAKAAEEALAEDNLEKFQRLREVVMNLPGVISSSLGLGLASVADQAGGTATAMGVLSSLGRGAGFNAYRAEKYGHGRSDFMGITTTGITGKEVRILPVNMTVNMNGDMLGSEMDSHIAKAMQEAAEKGAVMDLETDEGTKWSRHI